VTQRRPGIGYLPSGERGDQALVHGLAAGVIETALDVVEMMLHRGDGVRNSLLAPVLDDRCMFMEKADGLLTLPLVERLDQHAPFNELVQHFGQYSSVGNPGDEHVEITGHGAHAGFVAFERDGFLLYEGCEFVKAVLPPGQGPRPLPSLPQIRRH
jgi:hypothetical protein